MPNAASASSGGDRRRPAAASSAATSATPSAPELPNPEPAGTAHRVRSAQASRPERHNAALCRARRVLSASVQPFRGMAADTARSSASMRQPRPPGSTSASATREMAALTTAPPISVANGATSVQPPAKSSRTGALARKHELLVTGYRSLIDPPLAQAHQLSAEIHLHAMDAPVHPLHPPGVIEEYGGQGILNQPHNVLAARDRAQNRERDQPRQVAEGKIAGDSHDGSIEVVRGTLDAIEIGGQLELSQLGAHGDFGELGLEHLFQCRFSASHGQQLEVQRGGGAEGLRRSEERRVGKEG